MDALMVVVPVAACKNNAKPVAVPAERKPPVIPPLEACNRMPPPPAVAAPPTVRVCIGAMVAPPPEFNVRLLTVMEELTGKAPVSTTFCEATMPPTYSLELNGRR